MVTPQPTPPPNPTTVNEETPPTTPQQPQEPVDPQTTTINGNTDGETQTNPAATDSEGTGTELRVPTTSETINNPILRQSRDAIGAAEIAVIVLVVILVIVVTVAVVVIVAVIYKKYGKKNKGRALSNPAYGTQG